MKLLLSYVGQAIFAIVVGVFMAFMVLEWAVGCGETYVDSKGVRHANECLFLNQHKDQR